jgi:hypothetical protein
MQPRPGARPASALTWRHCRSAALMQVSSATRQDVRALTPGPVTVLVKVQRRTPSTKSAKRSTPTRVSGVRLPPKARKGASKPGLRRTSFHQKREKERPDPVSGVRLQPKARKRPTRALPDVLVEATSLRPLPEHAQRPRSGVLEPRLPGPRCRQAGVRR